MKQIKITVAGMPSDGRSAVAARIQRLLVDEGFSSVVLIDECNEFRQPPMPGSYHAFRTEHRIRSVVGRGTTIEINTMPIQRGRDDRS